MTNYGCLINKGLMLTVNSCDVIRTLSQPELKEYMLGGARLLMPQSSLETATAMLQNALGNVNMTESLPLGPLSANATVGAFPSSTGPSLLRAFGIPTDSSDAFNNHLIERLRAVDWAGQLTIKNGKAQIKPKIDLSVDDSLIPTNARVAVKSPRYCLPQKCIEKKCTNVCSPGPCFFGVCLPQVCNNVCSPRICTPGPCWPELELSADINGISTKGNVTIQPTIEHTCTDIAVVPDGAQGLSLLFSQTPEARIVDVGVTTRLDKNGTRISQTSLNAVRSVLDNVQIRLPWVTSDKVGPSAADLVDRAIGKAVVPRIEAGVSSAIRSGLVR
jgi:hypothetical protein